MDKYTVPSFFFVRYFFIPYPVLDISLGVWRRSHLALPTLESLHRDGEKKFETKNRPHREKRPTFRLIGSTLWKGCGWDMVIIDEGPGSGK